MRRAMIGFVAAAMLSVVGFAPTGAGAVTGEHPGCKGIDQAMSKANDKGKAALTVVSEKFGCGTVIPAVDRAFCDAGEVALARWVYAGTRTGPIEHGYLTWLPSAGWTSTVAGWTNTVPGPAAVDIGHAGGFYWVETTPGSVTSIVVVSMTDERVVVAGPSNLIGENVFTDRTGINLVTFCGGPAA